MLLLLLACAEPPADTGDSAAPKEWSSLSVTGQSVCALDPQGLLHCWGPAAEWASELDSATVSLGRNHACGLDAEGQAHCAGEDHYGETQPPSTAFLQVVVGDSLSCGLTLAGEPECWGWERVMPSLRGPFVELHLAGHQLCGVHSDGTVDCDGNMSTCGEGAPEADIAYTEVDQGGCHGCALDEDGRAHCWNAPQALIPPGDGWVDISAGQGFTCVLDAEGSTSCYGHAGEHLTETAPSDACALDAGDGTLMCALLDSGPSCWGLSDMSAALP
ncbi:MAG: hypothetical protein VX899_03715 [Myxococcota bacterium]|nr:hypothetical protein [Myxococcota bacterium]